MAIQVRRGLKKDFDPNKMLPGEWAVSIDSNTSNQIVWMCFAPGVCKRMGTYEDFTAQIAGATDDIRAQYIDEFNEILADIHALADTVSTDKDIVVVAKSDIVDTYIPQIQAYVNDAQTSASTATSKATSASTSASAAKSSETNAKTSENNAKTSETNSAASATAAKTSETNASNYASNASASASTATQKASDASNYASNAKASSNTANTHATTASAKASEASASANTAAVKANSASESAILAESYAVGGTGTRENEDVDNAKYYKEQAERISQGLGGALIPMGTITFADLKNQSKQSGYMYNISDSFTTDSTFKEGTGHEYAAGTNVYYTADGYWDCIAGTNVVGVKGAKETTYRQGNVNITPENIGALPEDGNALTATKATQDGNGNNIAETYQTKTGDTANNIISFSSGDNTSPTGWADINIVSSGESHASLFRKFSLAVKNLRFLYKMLGSTDISSISDGTVTGILSFLKSSIDETNSNLTPTLISLSWNSDYITNYSNCYSVGNLLVLSLLFTTKKEVPASTVICTLPIAVKYIPVYLSSNVSSANKQFAIIGTSLTTADSLQSGVTYGGSIVVCKA